MLSTIRVACSGLGSDASLSAVITTRALQKAIPATVMDQDATMPVLQTLGIRGPSQVGDSTKPWVSFVAIGISLGYLTLASHIIASNSPLIMVEQHHRRDRTMLRPSFFTNARLNLVWHCGRFGKIRALTPGWSVENSIVPTRLFNFDTGLETLAEDQLCLRLQHLSSPDLRSLLWHGPVVETADFDWKLLHTYQIMRYAPSKERVPASICTVLWKVDERPQWAADLLTTAYEEPRTQPYFNLLVRDPYVIWVLHEVGACVIRENFGIMAIYELAVLPDHRGIGIATALLTTALSIAFKLQMPLISHVPSGSVSETVHLKVGFQPVFKDHFFIIKPKSSSAEKNAMERKEA